MCLSIKGSRIPKIATRDIVVYKLFDPLELGKGKLVSPFTRFDFGLFCHGKVLKASKITISDIKRIIKYHIIGNGFIHCFTHSLSNRVKCIIPKGTLYYIDKYGDEICARKLEIIDYNFNNHLWKS